jgi:hypothetical protein
MCVGYPYALYIEVRVKFSVSVILILTFETLPIYES